MRIDFFYLQENLRRHLAPVAVASAVIALGVMLASSPRTAQASSKQAQAAGSAVFHDKGCQHCHGENAEGTDRGPDLSSVGRTWHKDRIEQQIRQGGNGMPAFGDLLQPDEIQSLVSFLSAKRKPVRKSNKLPPPAPPPVTRTSNDDSGD